MLVDLTDDDKRIAEGAIEVVYGSGLIDEATRTRALTALRTPAPIGVALEVLEGRLRKDYCPEIRIQRERVIRDGREIGEYFNTIVNDWCADEWTPGRGDTIHDSVIALSKEVAGG